MGLFSRLFNKNKLMDPADLSVLKTDVHSHFIPGIDDGSPNMEESLKLISAMSDLGFNKVITTPHVMSDYYRNTTSVILEGRDQLQKAIKEAGIPIELEAAAEYYCDEAFEELVDKDDILSFGDRYVLFEQGFMNEAPNLKSVLFKLQLAGYKPVMAHPERYPYWLDDPQKIIDYYEKGVLLQINVNSLTGIYSPEVKKVAEILIDEGVVSFLGSDCHHEGHINVMTEARRSPHLHKLLESGKLLNSKL